MQIKLQKLEDEQIYKSIDFCWIWHLNIKIGRNWQAYNNIDFWWIWYPNIEIGQNRKAYNNIDFWWLWYPNIEIGQNWQALSHTFLSKVTWQDIHIVCIWKNYLIAYDIFEIIIWPAIFHRQGSELLEIALLRHNEIVCIFPWTMQMPSIMHL